MEDTRLVNGALLKKYAGQKIHVYLQTAGEESAGGRQVRKVISAWNS